MPDIPGISGFNIAGDVLETGLGLYQFIDSQNKLKNLENTPFPEESVSPELQNAFNQAQQMSAEGYTPAEKASYQGQVNRASATNYAKASEMGGGQLGNSIEGAIAGDQLLSYDQFAAKDADLHRQNIANFEQQADKIQTQKNAIQDERIQHRYLLEEALGNANKAGLENIMKGLTIGGVGQKIGATSPGGQNTGGGGPSSDPTSYLFNTGANGGNNNLDNYYDYTGDPYGNVA